MIACRMERSSPASKVITPVPVVIVPLVASEPPLLRRVMAPVPVEKLKAGSVSVPVEIMRNG